MKTYHRYHRGSNATWWSRDTHRWRLKMHS